MTPDEQMQQFFGLYVALPALGLLALLGYLSVAGAVYRRVHAWAVDGIPLSMRDPIIDTGVTGVVALAWLAWLPIYGLCKGLARIYRFGLGRIVRVALSPLAWAWNFWSTDETPTRAELPRATVLSDGTRVERD